MCSHLRDEKSEAHGIMWPDEVICGQWGSTGSRTVSGTQRWNNYFSHFLALQMRKLRGPGKSTESNSAGETGKGDTTVFETWPSVSLYLAIHKLVCFPRPL